MIDIERAMSLARASAGTDSEDPIHTGLSRIGTGSEHQMEHVRIM
jgi:hypothetical protein